MQTEALPNNAAKQVSSFQRGWLRGGREKENFFIEAEIGGDCLPKGVEKMDIQEEIQNELLRLDVPLTSLGGFQFDPSQEPKAVKVDYEGVTGTFDPEDLLSLLQKLPDKAGSTVVVEAIRLSRDRR